MAKPPPESINMLIIGYRYTGKTTILCRMAEHAGYDKNSIFAFSDLENKDGDFEWRPASEIPDMCDRIPEDSLVLLDDVNLYHEGKKLQAVIKIAEKATVFATCLFMRSVHADIRKLFDRYIIDKDSSLDQITQARDETQCQNPQQLQINDRYGFMIYDKPS